MPAIVTITFNPALDKSVSVQELIPERKLHCSLPVYEPGGGGINVARAISKLGGKAVALYVAGGDAGKKITELLSEEDVVSVVTPIMGATRENLVVFENGSRKQYLFDMPGPVITAEEWQACLKSLEQLPGVEYIVASGSLPTGVPVDIFARIALIARRKKAKLVVDTSGEALKHAIEAGVYLIKPNLRELALAAGMEELNPGMAADAAKGLISRGRCEAVVVSMGPAGAMLVTKDHTVNIIPPKQTVKSTVGAGDSLVGGIVLGLAENRLLEDAVRFGVACGTAATINSGTELCRRPDADRLYPLVQSLAAEVC